MKKMLTVVTLAICGLLGFGLAEDNTKKPYVIQRGEEALEIIDMPKSTVSDPITNSFVYIDGEYIDLPYIVSVSNLAVCINGRIVTNYEPWVKKRESYPRRTGITPENVARSVDSEYQSLVNNLIKGVTFHFYKGGQLNSGMDDGSGALARMNLARKAIKGDNQAKQALIQEMRLENSLSTVHPDWIERLANNTKLEARATKILEAKREHERKEGKTP